MSERTPIRDLMKAGAVLLTLSGAAASDQDTKPEITDGTVYKKEHTVKVSTLVGAGRGAIAMMNWETEREVAGSSEPIHEVRGTDKEIISQHPNLPWRRSEYWNVSIAQCPTEESCPVEKIVEECKTATFSVSGEVFSNFQLGQHADFRQPK